MTVPCLTYPTRFAGSLHGAVGRFMRAYLKIERRPRCYCVCFRSWGLTLAPPTTATLAWLVPFENASCTPRRPWYESRSARELASCTGTLGAGYARATTSMRHATRWLVALVFACGFGEEDPPSTRV